MPVPAFGLVTTYGGPVAGNTNTAEGSGLRINLRGTFQVGESD